MTPLGVLELKVLAAVGLLASDKSPVSVTYIVSSVDVFIKPIDIHFESVLAKLFGTSWIPKDDLVATDAC